MQAFDYMSKEKEKGERINIIKMKKVHEFICKNWIESYKYDCIYGFGTVCLPNRFDHVAYFVMMRQNYIVNVIVNE